jgi:hypothetical protein
MISRDIPKKPVFSKNDKNYKKAIRRPIWIQPLAPPIQQGNERFSQTVFSFVLSSIIPIPGRTGKIHTGAEVYRVQCEFS